VVAPNPEKWFGTAMSHLDTSQLVPAYWETLDWSK